MKIIKYEMIHLHVHYVDHQILNIQMVQYVLKILIINIINVNVMNVSKKIIHKTDQQL